MRVSFLSVVLYVEDLHRSERFYTDILGFSRAFGGAGVVGLRRDNAQIIISVPNAHSNWSGPRFTGSVYLYVDDVDRLWEELKDRCRICYPVETLDYGLREFAVYDEDGYVIQFGQRALAA